MAPHDLLLDLFKSCQEKTNEGLKSFESDHFTWLEEAVVAARQTFAHKDPVLLPMTPAAKRLTKKRPMNRTIKDEGDSDEVPCPPAKRSLVEAPEEKPRRGRAASKAAQQKIKSGIALENFKGKIRRPDPEETMSDVTISKDPEQIKRERESLQSEASYTPQTKHRTSSSSTQESTEVVTPLKEEIPEATPMPSPSPVKSSKDQGSPRKKSIKYGKKDVSFMDSIRESDDSQEDEEEIEEEEKTDVPETAVCMVTEESSEVETEGMETDSMDEPLEMSALQLNETEVISRLNETEVICRLNETEVISKLNETEVISNLNETEVMFKLDETEVVCRLDETEIIDKTDSVTKLNETVIITKHNDTGIVSKLNETEAIKLTLTTDEDSNQNENTTESETENIINNDKTTESDDMPPPPVVEAPKSRSTRTKTRGKKSEPRAIEPATSEDEVIVPVEAPKSRSSRGKKSEPRKIEITTSEDDVHVEAPKPRSTRTKQKKAEEIPQVSTEETVPPSPKPRSTRTKKRQLDEEKAQPEKPARSTRTKRKKEEEEKAVEPQEESGFSLALSESEDEGVGESLDSKEMAVNSTYVKDPNVLNQSMESVSSEVSCKSGASSSKEVKVAQPPRRVTRSKVKPAAPVRDLSPRKTESTQSPRNHRTSRTPAKTPNKQYSPRPFASKTGSVKKMAEAYQNYVTESDENEGTQSTQSPRATRHSKGSSKASSTKRESYAQRCARKSLGRAKSLALAAGARTSSVDQDSMDQRKSRNKVSKISLETKTPTKTPDYPSEKVVRPRPVPMSGRVTPSQSGRITPKTFSRVKPIVSAYSSTAENRTKKVFTPSTLTRTKSVLGCTPNEMKRSKNIISGVSSFIKTQPSKPTKEEVEDKKKEELRKKKERGEEGKRKKDELIAKKMEEQKRRNEERMRKVQEARADRERKVIEAKQQQDNDKKVREERLKEDQLRKKQQAVAKKKADEELRLQKIREQQEEIERRRKEEERRQISEDNRIAEEARKAEAEKKARIAEQRRILEEKQKRAAEAERIARERQELERLRAREAERLAMAQKSQTLNETYNQQENKENSSTHNSTYSVQATPSSSTAKKERNDSYDMTPDRKPPPKKKTVDPNCYYIGDIASEDSTDDETQPKKKIPAWAQGTNLKAALVNQEYFPPEVNVIFPAALLLQMPDLSEMFPIQRRRFHKRGSSAIWNTPPSKLWAS